MTSAYSAKEQWQSPDRAKSYRRARDNYARAGREDAMIAAWIADLPKEATVLDVPCGTGRFTKFFVDRGYRYIGADYSRAMIAEARQSIDGKGAFGFANFDVERLPFADNSVDCIIIWRFLHHINDPATRQRILAEAARVSRRKVILSFYHPLSFTHLRRMAQQKFTGRENYRAALTHWRMARETEACGLHVQEFRSFAKFVSVNWFVCLLK